MFQFDRLTSNKLSDYQTAILEWAVKSASGEIDERALAINAVAGAGKSFMLITLAKLIGQIDPQANALFLAFNKEIVKALQGKLEGTGMTAQTINSLGHQTVARELGGWLKVEDGKYSDIAKLLARDLPEPPRDLDGDPIFEIADYIRNAVQLARIGRLKLVDFRDTVALDALCSDYDIEVLDESFFAFVKDMVNEGNDRADRQKLIDFADQVYLPCRWNLGTKQYDYVLVDECQDLNKSQRTLLAKAVKAGGRIIAVGDPKQAIYGFSGADNDSFAQVVAHFKAVEKPLSVTYRCPLAHVQLAQQYVPVIQSAPGAQEGVVTIAQNEALYGLVKHGDLILCRKTAPLIEACIKLIRSGIPARVRGRDVSATLVTLAKKIGKKYRARTPEAFLDAVETYREQEATVIGRQKDPEAKLLALNDRCDALIALQQGFNSPSVDALCASIEGLFADDGSNPPVWLSTIHRAKGLEADRVLVLEYDHLPMTYKGISRDQVEQEKNLAYVALTRSKYELVLFYEKPPVIADVAAIAPMPELAALPTPQFDMFDVIDHLEQVLDVAV